MPSRQLSPSPSPAETTILRHGHHHRNGRLVPPIATSAAGAFSLLILVALCFRRISRKRTVPADSRPPHPFSYAALRRATGNFAAANRLGQGGFGSVYRGALTNGLSKDVAVKVMDAGSLQGEREFQNELFFAGKIDCKYVVSVLGFSSDRKRRRMMLVYELMANGSLQDCLLHRKCPELMDWKKRLSIALDIARGLEFLHHHCDQTVIHGDIKPSNILLDQCFNAKIGDFGLARLKTQDLCEVVIDREIEGKKKELESNGGGGGAEDNGSVMEETASVATTNFEEFNVAIDQSPEDFLRVRVSEVVEASPETVVGVETETSPDTETVEASIVSPRTVKAMASPSEGLEKMSLSEGNFDRLSTGSGKEMVKQSGRRKNSSGKDWWWKQDNGGNESGSVKDYVMEWIGNEIKKERPKTMIGTSSTSGPIGKAEKKKNKRRTDWWASLDEDKNAKKEKRRPAREWWKEEYCEELVKKKKKKKIKGQESTSDGHMSDSYWPRDDSFYAYQKKKRSRSRGSRGSVDWWLDGLSGELWRARRNSHDSVSGEIPRSGGISSTPSMRGTVCYVAPEYSGGGDISEKCDVYSFGVLLLVLISGRRPLQVTGSPMSEFQRANLLSWARHLARAGKLLDLVDQSIQSLDQEQALIYITVALLCLQKSPAKRPTMKEVVGMLSGKLGAPKLPIEFSPSPPSRYPLKSHKKVR